MSNTYIPPALRRLVYERAGGCCEYCRPDHWIDHFHVHAGQVVPLTPTGCVTVRLLQLNHPDRVEERTLLMTARLSRFPE